MSMYVRVKRKRQTIFLHCEPNDRIQSLKVKIEAINKIQPDDQRLQMVEEKFTYDESKTLKECKLEDGAIIALIYKKPGDANPPEWEEIDIENPGQPNSEVESTPPPG